MLTESTVKAEYRRHILIGYKPEYQESNNQERFATDHAYTPKERWYFLYATDGIAWLPTDKFGLTRRPVYTYGFSTPMSWNTNHTDM